MFTFVIVSNKTKRVSDCKLLLLVLPHRRRRRRSRCLLPATTMELPAKFSTIPAIDLLFHCQSTYNEVFSTILRAQTV